ncbi:MAG TPA: arginine--tRNA ligase, partial [Patescibacteria group bacterium]|nr:arginine--tRNA ligase [Patescibacteria group bacterium]
MTVLHKITHTIASAVGTIVSAPECIKEVVSVMTVSHSQWGDISFPCFSLAKNIQKSPHEIAEEIADKIVSIVPEIISARADNGYVNMTLDNAFLFQVIDAVRSAGAVYGMAPTDTPFTYIVEYASPNTNKPLHLGHMRNIALGQALIAFLTYCGHQVIATEIINDRGIHIMKSILAYQKWGNNETPESTGMKGDHFVGMYYVLFSQRAKEDPTLEEDAQKLLQRYEQGEQEICSLWKQMNTWVVDGIKQTYRRLGVKFDEEDFESDIFEQGKQVVADGLEKGVFKKRDDGAVYADLSDAGLGQKIVLRADGTAIYITQDLALAQLRTARHPGLAGVLYVVAREQEYHFKVLFELLRRLGFSWAEKCAHVSYGLVNLPTGRMKSREGTVVDADALLDELSRLASQEIQQRW